MTKKQSIHGIMGCISLLVGSGWVDGWPSSPLVLYSPKYWVLNMVLNMVINMVINPLFLDGTASRAPAPLALPKSDPIPPSPRAPAIASPPQITSLLNLPPRALLHCFLTPNAHERSMLGHKFQILALKMVQHAT